MTSPVAPLSSGCALRCGGVQHTSTQPTSTMWSWNGEKPVVSKSNTTALIAWETWPGSTATSFAQLSFASFPHTISVQLILLLRQKPIVSRSRRGKDVLHEGRGSGRVVKKCRGTEIGCAVCPVWLPAWEVPPVVSSVKVVHSLPSCLNVSGISLFTGSDVPIHRNNTSEDSAEMVVLCRPYDFSDAAAIAAFLRKFVGTCSCLSKRRRFKL